ncbi:MAG: D-2-hydroxyacid dehydrogenase [Anaerolineae bacterium]|nr:D-2-hydroxyacid dehydrogenase [Anaerolineae bacterium]
MDRIHVLCTLRFSTELLDQLSAMSATLHVEQYTCRDAREVAAALVTRPNVEVLYTFHVPDDILTIAPNLKWVQLHSAGIDHILGAPIMDSQVLITTTSGIHATPIAEYVMASILAHRWRVPHWTACQREAKWPSGRWDLYARPELLGSTIGILGYGSIGREVARLAQAFGMRVLAFRRLPADKANPPAGEPIKGYIGAHIAHQSGMIPERVYGPAELHEMLPECDYVVIALPLTSHTRHLIGDGELRAMKPGAYLVNIARGAIVDEMALIQALREGWIAGAGLDVFEQEPLPADSPLWGMDHALISPHVAGFTPRYDERAAQLFAENLTRYTAGGPLLNLVDKARGY